MGLNEDRSAFLPLVSLFSIWIPHPCVYDWGLLGLTCPREADEQWLEHDGKHFMALRA